MSMCQQSPSSEETRQAHLRWLTNHLPPFPNSPDDMWIWQDDEVAILRAACAARFNESIRTESLFCIAASAIRIYLERAANEKAPTGADKAEG